MTARRRWRWTAAAGLQATALEARRRHGAQGRSRLRQQMGEDRGRHGRVLTGDGLQGQRRRRWWRPPVGIDDEDGNAERMKRRPAVTERRPAGDDGSTTTKPSCRAEGGGVVWRLTGSVARV
ncbi:hypothetical protein E2562_022443 [Oryza meyeriana var. granulata]|uniref:DUF834 domain-containing protein n=1 Tax=Oryza meyeriana var. granulata TaxID=110450 RepID=A0A6G1BMM8_9ORYZ|nr:hypothetical protein E2562_022443 [Oryza meyeriana var. granulata]